MSALARLRGLAARHDAQFATQQALNAGLTRNELLTLRRHGHIMRMRRSVYRFAGVPGEPDAAVTAYLAALPDGIVAKGSAARRHQLLRVSPPDRPQLLLPHDIVRKLPGVELSWTRRLPAGDTIEIGGVRCTTMARTVVDLSDPQQPWQTLALVDDAVAAGASPAWLHGCAKALAFGRAGPGLVRDATAPGAAGVFRSWLERAAAHLYRAAHLPDPEWNVRVSDEDGLIGIVDALWRPWSVINELEGLAFHSGREALRRDAARFNRLTDGHIVRRFTWEDVAMTPVTTAVSAAKALRRAGADIDLNEIPRRIVLPRAPFLI